MPLIIQVFNNTRAFLTREQNNILRTSFSMMVIILITKMTGFLYGALVAKQLGASRQTDLFLLANTIPETLGNLILVGLIGAALMPMLVKAKSNDGHEKFVKLLNSLLNVSLLGFIIVGSLVIIFGSHIFPIVINTILPSKVSFTPAELNQAASMMRMLMIPQIILGISAFYSSALNVMNRFLIPQLSPLLYNLGRIVGAYFVVPWVGGVEGLVWGTILGSILHLLIQIPLAYTLGLRYKLVLDTKDKYFKESVSLGGPRLIGLGGEYVAGSIDRFIAARFIAGSVTALDFAQSLVSIPLSLFGTTFAIASFPTLAKYYQTGEYGKFEELFMRVLNQIAFFAIPVSIVLLVLRVSLVRLFFGIFGGEFSFEDTYLTAWGVAFFSVGLVFESLRSLFYRIFYAVGDTRRPMAVAIFRMVAGIVTGLAFTNYFSHFDAFNFGQFSLNYTYLFSAQTGKAAIGGLALSASVVSILEFIILMFLLHKSDITVNLVELVYKLLKKTLAGTFMGVFMFAVFKVWGNSDLQTRTIFLVFFVASTSMVGTLIYICLSALMKVEEVDLIRRFFERVHWKKLMNIKSLTNIKASALETNIDDNV